MTLVPVPWLMIVNDVQLMNSEGNSQYSFMCQNGHIFRNTPHRIFSGKYKCHECYIENLEHEAAAIGLWYVDKITKDLCLYVCKENHCFISRPAEVRKGVFSCKQCRINKYAASAEDQCVEFIKKINSYDALYKCKQGHNFSSNISHLSKGYWKCPECDPDLDKKTCLYLFKISSDNFTWLKLGYASNLPLRLMRYGLDTADVDVLFSKYSDKRKIISAERLCHKLLSGLKLDSKMMKGFMKKNGFTECYSIDDVDTVLSTMEDVLFELNCD